MGTILDAIRQPLIMNEDMINQKLFVCQFKKLSPIATLLIFAAKPLHGQSQALIPDATVLSVAFSPDGKVLAAGQDEVSREVRGRYYFKRGQLHLWNLQTLKLGWIRTDLPFTAVNLAFSPDSRTIVAGNLHDMRLWNVQTGELVSHLFGLQSAKPMDEVNTVAFWPDSKTIAFGGLSYGPTTTSQVFLYNASTGRLQRKLQYRFITLNRAVWATALSPNGRMVATSVSRPGSESEGRDPNLSRSLPKDAEVWVWNTSGQLKHVFKSQQRSTSILLFSPDSQMLAGTDYGAKTIHIWNVQTGKLLRTLTDTCTVQTVAFSPDGRTLASGSSEFGGKPKLWNIQTGNVLRTLNYSDWVISLAFSPNGRTLAIGGYEGVKLLRLK